MKATVIYMDVIIDTVLSIDCGDPGMLRDGVVSYEDTHLGSVAEFTCNFGFKLTGDGARTCRPDGMWSHMVPTCIRKLTPAIQGENFVNFV